MLKPGSVTGAGQVWDRTSVWQEADGLGYLLESFFLSAFFEIFFHTAFKA